MELLRVREIVDKYGGIRGESIWKCDLATCSLLQDPVDNLGDAGTKVEHNVQQTNFQVDLFGLLSWLRDIYLAFVDKFFSTANGPLT